MSSYLHTSTLQLQCSCCSRPYRSGATPAKVQPLAPRRGVGARQQSQGHTSPRGDHPKAGPPRVSVPATTGARPHRYGEEGVHSDRLHAPLGRKQVGTDSNPRTTTRNRVRYGRGYERWPLGLGLGRVMNRGVMNRNTHLRKHSREVSA